MSPQHPRFAKQRPHAPARQSAPNLPSRAAFGRAMLPQTRPRPILPTGSRLCLALPGCDCGPDALRLAHPGPQLKGLDLSLERTDLPQAPTPGEDFLAVLEGRTGPRALAGTRVEAIRELTPDDLLLVDDGQVIQGPTNLTSIRHAHHRIAQLLVEGSSRARVSLITGYSPGYIGRLEGDPVFKELLAYYASQAEQITVDIRERLTSLGLSAMDEIQRRFEENPAEFTKKDLMEIVKQAVPTGVGTGGAGAGAAAGPAVALNVQFVSAAPTTDPLPVIDAKVSRLPPEQEI